LRFAYLASDKKTRNKRRRAKGDSGGREDEQRNGSTERRSREEEIVGAENGEAGKAVSREDGSRGLEQRGLDLFNLKTYFSFQKDLFLGSSLLFSFKTVESAIPISDLHILKTDAADVTVRFHSYSSGPRHGHNSSEFSTYDWRKVRQWDFASSRSRHKPDQTSAGSISCITSTKNLRARGEQC
jgi:hypothetical protein